MNRIEHTFDADGDRITNVWFDDLHSRLQGHYPENQAFGIIQQWRKDAARIKYVQH